MKLHQCNNGLTVTEQVVIFQKTQKTEDYRQIQNYYDQYKDQWFKQVEEYMDRSEFEGEFDYKLYRAVESFNEVKSTSLAKENDWSDLGRFNRWFFRILAHWKSNVRNAAIRLKKTPGAVCPVCGRLVGKINQEHLEHYKTTKDLPSFFVWKKHIYELCLTPASYAITWGVTSKEKIALLNKGEQKSLASQKKKVKWPWRLTNGDKGVYCPLSKTVVPVINNEYIMTLSSKINRYAKRIDWSDFVEHYPTALIQSEIYSLDHGSSEDGEELYLKDSIPGKAAESNYLDYEKVCNNQIPLRFESVFANIEKYIDDEQTKDVLKMLAIGYEIEDIAESLNVTKVMVKNIVKNVRENSVIFLESCKK